MILRIPAFIRTIAHDINAATPTTVIGNGFFYHDKQHYISFHHLPFNHYPFLKAIENLDRFQYRGNGAFQAWLFRIAINTVNAHFRQRDMLSIDDVPEIESRHPQPDDVLIQKERFLQLHHLVHTLSPRRQEIITLRFFGGLRNQEIAAILHLDERTVASHLVRGLNDLQARYTEATPHER